MPWYTKTVCAATAFLSVALFALPASMLTWAFEAEAQRLMTKEAERRREEASKGPEEHGAATAREGARVSTLLPLHWRVLGLALEGARVSTLLPCTGELARCC